MSYQGGGQATGLASVPLYVGEPPEPWMSPEVEERARKTVLWCVGESQRHYQDLRYNWDDWFDRYTNQPTKFRQSNRIRSNVPSGMASEMVDTFRSDMMDSIFKKRPIVNAIPQEPDDFDSARVNEALIQFQFEQMEYWKVIDQAVFQALVWGLGLAKMAWVNKVVRRPLIGIADQDGFQAIEDVQGYRGPVQIPVFIYDAYPHPGKVWPDDLYPIAHITHESYGDLEALHRSGVYTDKVKDIPDKEYAAKHENVSQDEEDKYERVDQRARLGWSSDTRLDPDGVMVVECECMFRPKVDWKDSHGRKHRGEEPVRTIITMANGCIIRLAPSPTLDGSSVWLGGKISHLPGQFYGHSLIQKNKPHLHVSELALNMGLQNLSQAVNRLKIVRPDLVFNAQSWDDAPGGVIIAKPTANNLDQVVRTLESPPVANDIFRFIQLGESRLQATSGAVDLKSGRVPEGETTATESNLAFKQASIRFRHALGWFGQTFITPGATKMHSYNRLYLDAEYNFLILGKQGRHLRPLKEEDLAVNVDYVFLGPDRAESEQMRVAQLENLMKITTSLAQFGWAQPLLQDIFVQIAEGMNWENMDKLKELMGYGQPPPTLGIMEPPSSMAGVAGAGPGPGSGVPSPGIPTPSRRRDTRVTSPVASAAKSIGGRLSRGGGGLRV